MYLLFREHSETNWGGVDLILYRIADILPLRTALRRLPTLEEVDAGAVIDHDVVAEVRSQVKTMAEELARVNLEDDTDEVASGIQGILDTVSDTKGTILLGYGEGGLVTLFGPRATVLIPRSDVVRTYLRALLAEAEADGDVMEAESEASEPLLDPDITRW